MPLDLESLSQEDRAFVEVMDGIHREVVALKLAFPEGGRHALALTALQGMLALITAATIKVDA